MSDWLRVNRVNRCPLCNSDHWCTYTEDGAVICMRVQSDREVPHKDGAVGWLHKTAAHVPTSFARKKPGPKVTINAKKLMEEFCADADQWQLEKFAEMLGVSPSSLGRLGCGWSRRHHAWAFPMRDGYDNIVGIRLRSIDGRKWAVTGSHQGIFYPPTNGHKQAFVLEGPTDTAAALTLGLYGVGRPHCSGGMEPIQALFRRHLIREAVIVADNDEPGINGAMMLQRHLNIRTSIITLPCKDLRQFLVKGGDREDLDELVSNLVWNNPETQ